MTPKIASMFSDVLSALVSKPATVRFPAERTDTPDQLRGLVEWDASLCNGCGLCVKDCPALALDLIVIDKPAKRFVMRYHIDRCTFCAQCVASCNRDAIHMAADEWELATTDKAALEIAYGSETDLQAVVDGLPAAGSEPQPAGGEPQP